MVMSYEEEGDEFLSGFVYYKGALHHLVDLFNDYSDDKISTEELDVIQVGKNLYLFRFEENKSFTTHLFGFIEE